MSLVTAIGLPRTGVAIWPRMTSDEPTVAIGSPAWTRDEMRKHLKEFADLYARRPVKDNEGGMKSPHLFAMWFALKTIKPNFVVESGVWRGQGTWFIEQACPEATLFCIDPNLSRLDYRSPRAEYTTRDFSTVDWTRFPVDSALAFFDDHQDAYERMKTMRWFGFRRAMFEDNYPPGKGDCYSLKKVFAGAGHTPQTPKTPLGRVARFLGKETGIVAPNTVDRGYLLANLETYLEMPPILKASQTRWGDPWDARYPTPDPLLPRAEESYHRIFEEEAMAYTWICYVELRERIDLPRTSQRD